MKVRCYFKDIRQQILSEIEKSQVSIHIAVAWFTNNELFEAICTKAKQGIMVELIIVNDYINNRYDGLKFEQLIVNGGNFYFSKIDEPIHHKFCIIDGQTLLNGSYNWTYYAEEINKENFQIFTDCNILVGQFNEEFNSLKKNLNKVDKIIPISIDYMDLYDLQNAKSYLARDFLIFANYASSKKKFDEALVILEKSRNFSSGKVSFIKATENIEKHIRLTKANIEKEIVNENIDSEIQQKSNQADNLKAEEIKRLLLEGKIAFYSQRYEKALEVYKKGLELLPGNYGCLMGLSRVSWKTKDFDQLCKYATLAANSSSGKKSAAALNFLALVYLDVKVDKSKALHYLDKCIELAPGNHVYYWNKRNV